MDPQEKHLLEQVVKLSKENNDMLRKIQRNAQWMKVWGFIKLVIIVVPLVLGYLYLQPYFDMALKNLETVQDLFQLTN